MTLTQTDGLDIDGRLECLAETALDLLAFERQNPPGEREWTLLDEGHPDTVPYDRECWSRDPLERTPEWYRRLPAALASRSGLCASSLLSRTLLHQRRRDRRLP